MKIVFAPTQEIVISAPISALVINSETPIVTVDAPVPTVTVGGIEGIIGGPTVSGYWVWGDGETILWGDGEEMEQ